MDTEVIHHVQNISVWKTSLGFLNALLPSKYVQLMTFLFTIPNTIAVNDSRTCYPFRFCNPWHPSMMFARVTNVWTPVSTYDVQVVLDLATWCQFSDWYFHRPSHFLNYVHCQCFYHACAKDTIQCFIWIHIPPWLHVSQRLTRRKLTVYLFVFISTCRKSIAVAISVLLV